MVLHLRRSGALGVGLNKVPLRTAKHHKRGSRVHAVVVESALSVRPYTIRKGDTLSSICVKREIAMEDVLQLNQDLDPDNILAGTTILLPAGKLSKRDMEIVNGIKTGASREYPVREGETLADILERRKITMDEFLLLNPETDPEEIKAGQIILLPSGKFTVREQEMLTGSGIVPKEYFTESKYTIFPSVVFGVILGATGAYWYFKGKAKDDS
uniref:Chitinase-related protein n=1 Tax=Tetraselmis sp. GSL018 TaxID=582737 RepID=A0A061S4E5_9CHLO|mmetsp:Transcript_5290/g.12889  ORF Transcript_5290/g.12889 Transcript_5290/m.12889 type:complete len:213 (+) Transcript_5290:130-768(+)